MELLFLNQCWYVLLTHICFTQPQQVKGTQVSNPPKYETVPITDFFTFLFLPLRWAAKGPQPCDLTNSCSWPTWPWPSCPGALALPRSPRCPVCHTCFVTQRCNNNFSHAVSHQLINDQLIPLPDNPGQVKRTVKYTRYTRKSLHSHFPSHL